MTERKLSATDAALKRRNLICMISAEGKTKRELAREVMQAVEKWTGSRGAGPSR